MTVCHHFRASFYQPELNIDPIDRLKHLFTAGVSLPQAGLMETSHIYDPKDVLTYKSLFCAICV